MESTTITKASKRGGTIENALRSLRERIAELEEDIIELDGKIGSSEDDTDDDAAELEARVSILETEVARFKSTCERDRRASAALIQTLEDRIKALEDRLDHQDLEPEEFEG